MNATMSLEKMKHYPVMLNQILSIISPQHGGMFIDCTFGGGGYSRAILKFPNTKVVAIDRDKIVEQFAKKFSTEFPDRFKNVGSSEQLMIGLAVGLTYTGFTVLCYSITPFLLF